MTHFCGHDDDWAAISRLWQAVKRDYFVAVEGSAGLPFDERRRDLLLRNWERLCERAPTVATRLARALHEIDVVFSDAGTSAVKPTDQDCDDRDRRRTPEESRLTHPSEGGKTLGTLIDLAAHRRPGAATVPSPTDGADDGR